MLGTTLRQERERQKLSVNDIEQGTSIRAFYIEAIENGEYDKLPGEVYTRGFIKNYANFLGLEGDAFARQFTAELHGAPPAAPTPAAPTPVAPTPVMSTPVVASTPVVENPSTAKMNFNPSPVPERQPEIVKPAKSEKKNKPIGGAIDDRSQGSSGKLIVAAVVIIAALAGGAWSFLSGADDGGDVAKVNPPAQTQPVAQPEPQQTPVANANPAPKSDKISIEARFTDRCWTLATVDGQVVLEGVVEAGETLSWEGKNSVNLRLGNAGAVELFQDGKDLGVQGNIGEVVDKTFNRQ